MQGPGTTLKATPSMVEEAEKTFFNNDELVQKMFN